MRAAALLRRAADLRFSSRRIFADLVATRFAVPLFQCRRPFDPRGCPPTANWAPPSSPGEVDAAARDVAAALADIDDDAVAELIFADWAERVMMHLLPPQNACVWLQCVADPGAWRGAATSSASSSTSVDVEL